MKNLLVFVWLMVPVMAMAQSTSVALEAENLTLKERYYFMKEKSQTFKDYKVIKENVLDGVWKIVQDSIAADKAQYKEAQASIAKLESDLSATQTALKEKEQSMQEVEFASTHITVLGIDFAKGAFNTIVAILVLGLVGVIGLLVARMKVVRSSYSEKRDSFNQLTADYEEYKRKALDKQMKLSRELQDERNKLAELRH
ncbi:MAG: hypothetical protein HC859_09360 [Bacteroidia bacterium]|nr:hypothetical protein [Bacteroidia bacterium]